MKKVIILLSLAICFLGFSQAKSQGLDMSSFPTYNTPDTNTYFVGVVFTSDGTPVNVKIKFSSANAGITSLTALSPLTGGTITTSGSIGLGKSGVMSGTYGGSNTYPVITVDTFGRVTSISIETVTATLTASAPLSITGGNISLNTSGVSAGSYSNASIVVDAYGRITSASNGSGGSGTVTSITAANGLTGGTITTSGSIGLQIEGTAGTYGSSTLIPIITVDAYGRATAISTSAPSVAWSNVTSTPTSLSGYGVTAVPWSLVTGSPAYITKTSLSASEPLLYSSSSGNFSFDPSYSNTFSASQTINGGNFLTLTNSSYSNSLFTLVNGNFSILNSVSGYYVSFVLQSLTGDFSITVPNHNFTFDNINTSTTTSLTGFLLGNGTSISSYTTIPSSYIGNLTGGQVGLSGLSATGTASSSTFLRGDYTWASLQSSNLPTTGTAGTYGSSTQIPVITVDAYGRVTSTTNTAMMQNFTSFNNQTGTSYTFVIGDANQWVTSNNSGAVTFTIPTNASVAFPVNTVIQIVNYGAGKMTLSPASGVTITQVNSYLSLTQSNGGFAVKTATNTWFLFGAWSN